MKTKAIIFDIDGTAIDSPIQKAPTKSLVNEIDRLREKYNFCAATGRGWTYGAHVLKGLGLTDPCAISAGTIICNPQSGEILWQNSMTNEQLRAILEIAKQYPNGKYLINDYSEDDYLNGGLSINEINPEMQNVHFFEFTFVPQSIASEVCSKLSHIQGITPVLVVAQKPGFNDIHLINETATKEHAIAEMLKMIGVDKSDTIGIGDGNNDIHLFNAVNYKVAMGNAVESLKKQADKVIGLVSEDGLAEYLKTL